jgi:hypothetical protein
VSKRTDAKKARREKRRAARDVNWIPESVIDELAEDVLLVEDLERFDARVTERGWAFDDQQSDDEFAIWFYPPSGAEVGDGFEPVTAIWLHAPENAELVHLVRVGTAEHVQLSPEEFFARLDEIEAYRSGDSTTP